MELPDNEELIKGPRSFFFFYDNCLHMGSAFGACRTNEGQRSNSEEKKKGNSEPSLLRQC